ncbi:MAG: FecR domain-containing protein [Geminicoccaceae bacterium]|nr:FecR domain-containing protein [Geminicoccaceae bacterium]
MPRPEAAVALIGLLGAPAGAADWLYIVRPGDHLWNIAERYLRDRSRWLELGRYNGLSDPDRLEPGTILEIPIAWLQVRPAPAHLVAVRGAVRVQVRDGSERSAAIGLRLEAGDRLVTGPDATALVRFADGSQLEVHPDCEIVFDRLAAYGRSVMVDTRLRLERGRLRARVQRGTGGFGIETPAAVAAVRGTAFRIAADPAATRIVGLECRVAVEAAGVVRTVGAGTRTIARAGEAPVAPRALLPPPRLAGPLSAESVPQRVRLEPFAGAAAYRFELLQPGPEGALLLARTTNAPELVFDLPDGDYRLRARYVDRDGIEGRDLEGLLAIRARPEPPVPLRPRRGAIERQERPRFAWAAPEGAEGYRVQLARDPGFAEPILDRTIAGAELLLPSPDPGRWYVRSRTIEADGFAGPWSPAQAIDVPWRNLWPIVLPLLLGLLALF